MPMAGETSQSRGYTGRDSMASQKAPSARDLAEDLRQSLIKQDGSGLDASLFLEAVKTVLRNEGGSDHGEFRWH